MAVLLRCPDCRRKFQWETKKPWPRECPLCAADINNDREDSDVVMPFIRSAATKANDDLYRQMEAGSEKRAEIAAEQAGVPVSEMSGLKITDLNSTRHAGDVAAVPVNNPVSQFMQANPQAAIGFQGGQGAQYSGAVQTGPSPNAGARAQTMVRQMHAERMGWDKVGDAPALETQQPGYRRRG